MGMDCIPKNKDVEPFYANWTGWRFLGRVLVLSGADTSELSESNYGDLVSAKTTKTWAKMLKKTLARRGPLKLKLAKVPDISYKEGYFVVPVIDFGVGWKIKYGVNPNVIEQIRSYSVNKIPNENKITIGELDNDLRKFIRRFARFCECSGGFRQC